MMNETLASQQEQEVHYSLLFDAMQGNSILLKKNASHYTIIAATPGYLINTGTQKEDIIGEDVFKVFPANPSDPADTGVSDIQASLDHVLQHKILHYLPVQRYDLANEDGTYTKHYWRTTNSPILNTAGEVSYIIHTIENITDQVVAEQMEQRMRGMEQAHNLFMQAPVAIYMLRGEALIVELANQPTLELWNKDSRVIGQPFFETLPEWRGDRYDEMMHEVMHTGKSKALYESPVLLNRKGKEERGYFNFLYQPYYEIDKTKAVGVMVFATEVTEQVLARKHAEESEERFRSLADQSPMIIYIIAPSVNTTLRYYNQAWLDYTGQQLEQALERGWDGFVHPDDEQTVLDIYRPAFEQRQSYTIPAIRIKRYDGAYRWHLFKGNPRYLPTGEFVGYVGVGIDIHEQKLNEQALQQSEQQVRSLVASAPFPIGVYIGREMRIQLTNQAILDAWGKTSEEVIGKRYAEVLPELEEQRIYEQLDSVFTTGLPYHAKNRRVDLMIEGRLQTFYFNYSFTPLFDANGNVYGLMNTAADVTDLNVAKQQVEQSEKNFRNMILQAPVAMCILLGPEHIVEVANKAMIQLWGKEEATVMKKPLFEGLPDAREQGLEQLLLDVYEHGSTFEASERPVELFRNEKWETVYQNFVYVPYLDADGNTVGVLAISIDVTEQVLARQKIELVVAERTGELAKANEALVRSNQELARSNINLEEFAYAASHDLKEPIRKIHFFTDRLKARLEEKLDEQDIQLFTRMETATRRMGSLIDDLLSYSQVSLKPKVLETVDLNSLINTVLTDLDLEVEEKKAQIRVDKLFTLQGHQRQLQQAFQNLIGNALKYSRQAVPPEIKITCNKVSGADTNLPSSPDVLQKEFLIVAVCDNGIGFEQKDAERIFNVFTRLHGNAEYKGTGVGLSIVRKVMENHNGYIIAESEPGVGTCFKLFFTAE
jgi:PAS domain S-box-containing protein